MFPARTRICIDCRVAMTEDESCTWLSHAAVELASDCEPLIAMVWGASDQRDRPLGAVTEPMVPVTATGFRGRIAEGPTAPDPVGGARGVGFGLEVRHREAAGSPIMLRDGATVGFAVTGDDDRMLLVPPAGLRTAADRRAAVERNRRRVDSYLRALAPQAGSPSPFPWDEARVTVLVPGDLVTVRAVVSVSPDPRASTAYRDAPRSILLARGAVWIERHS